jgi:hypothetical protein
VTGAGNGIYVKLRASRALAPGLDTGERAYLTVVSFPGVPAGW